MNKMVSKLTVFKPTSATNNNVNVSLPSELEQYKQDSFFSQFFNQQMFSGKVGFSYGENAVLLNVPANQDFYVTYFHIDGVCPPFAFLNADSSIQIMIQTPDGTRNLFTLGLIMLAFRSNTEPCIPASITCNPTIPLKITGPCRITLNCGVANSEGTCALYGYLQSKSVQSH